MFRNSLKPFITLLALFLVIGQVRLQPETVQKVINYTIVIDADNDKNLLLTGMTATVEFIIEQCAVPDNPHPQT